MADSNIDDNSFCFHFIKDEEKGTKDKYPIQSIDNQHTTVERPQPVVTSSPYFFLHVRGQSANINKDFGRGSTVTIHQLFQSWAEKRRQGKTALRKARKDALQRAKRKTT